MRPHFIFDFPRDHEARQLLAFGSPQKVFCAEKPDEVLAVLRAADVHARAGAWVAGYVSYEAAEAFDPSFQIQGRTAMPLAWFGVFAAPLPDITLPSATTDKADFWQPSIDRARFDRDIAALRQYIFDGDAYQINYTLRLNCRFAGDDLAWFAQLRNAQPAGYCAYLDLGHQRIFSVSPELFFRRDGDLITTRPMKGTTRRGRWSAEDLEMADWLRHSEKNRAENLMITDLLRNDLSRIALPHSVLVPAMFSIERHPTVWQMTSTVTAQARPQIGLDELFSALFPCGSVTGAPKAKAMELIARHETTPRGIYCGAIGLIRPGGDAVFNVAIRTVVLDNGVASCGVGGGITWESTASDEYAEVLVKARFLDEAPEDFRLFETLRLEAGDYWLLERHLARLGASADYFGFPFDSVACRQKLAALAQRQDCVARRVRLTLGSGGDIAAHVAELPASPVAPATFALAISPVPRDAIWLYHKTTRRGWYEQALAAHPDVFDVLLWNEDRQLTEFTRGNLVLEIDGGRFTPPLQCGLLDGTLRRELLERGEVEERELGMNELKVAKRISFINSLRGEIELLWNQVGLQGDQ